MFMDCKDAKATHVMVLKLFGHAWAQGLTPQ
jgi:hypothetical protein